MYVTFSPTDSDYPVRQAEVLPRGWYKFTGLHGTTYKQIVIILNCGYVTLLILIHSHNEKKNVTISHS